MASHIVVDVLEGRNFETANPYISFSVNEKKYKTKLAKKTSNPKWNETFVFDKDPNMSEIIFTIYDSKLSVKLGISQLRVKIGQFTLPLTHPLLTSNSSSTSSVSSSTSAASSSSTPTPQAGMTVIFENWYQVEREKNAKFPEKEKPHNPEVHLRVEVVPGPMRTAASESVKSPDKEKDLSYVHTDVTATATATDDTTGTYISDDEHDSPELKPRRIERTSIKMESANEKSTPTTPTTPITSPLSSLPTSPMSPMTPLSPYTSPPISPLSHVPPARPLPTVPSESPRSREENQEDSTKQNGVAEVRTVSTNNLATNPDQQSIPSSASTKTLTFAADSSPPPRLFLLYAGLLLLIIYFCGLTSRFIRA
jgi:hypothetical protein